MRLVAATNHDLADLVGSKRFRADLYYRVNTLVLRVPPLRERAADMPLLAAALLRRLAAEMGSHELELAPEAIEATRQAFDEADGPILAFCKSGTRSTYVWALARSLSGADGDTLVGQAADAGYDLTPIRRFLR